MIVENVDFSLFSFLKKCAMDTHVKEEMFYVEECMCLKASLRKNCFVSKVNLFYEVQKKCWRFSFEGRERERERVIVELENSKWFTTGERERCGCLYGQE